MQELQTALEKTQIVYIAREAERALGIPPENGYYIITNWLSFAKASTFAKASVDKSEDKSPFAKSEMKTGKLEIRNLKKGNSIIEIKGERILDTHELLQRPETEKLLNSLSNPRIIVFKNTKLIEKICAEKGWKLLNPSASLSAAVEEKISALEWLGDLQKFLPPHRVLTGKELSWDGKKFIIQFNHAHTGSGTELIGSAEQVKNLKDRFPERPMRLTDFVIGPVFTCNCVVWGENIFTSTPSYQITGLEPFTDRPFATVGNDWSLAVKLLSENQLKQIKQMAEEIGTKLARQGWKGLFGIDVVADEETGNIFLIEINARQPASTTYESELQKGIRKKEKGISTFEAHLCALLEIPNEGPELVPVGEGAQVILRVNHEFRIMNHELSDIVEKLKKIDVNVIEYNNDKPGDDLLRIQSKRGIMADCRKFNDLGQEIVKNLPV